MADETAPPIGNPSIHRVVGAARAAAATAHATPALPPDQSAAPWASPFSPQPDNLTTPRAQAEREAREHPGPMSTPRRPRAKVSSPEFSRQRRAWDLLTRLMEQWSKDSKTSLGKANSQLSQRLGESGVVLLREGIPMGAVGDLVRLCNELARTGADEAADDPRIVAMQEALKREIPDVPFEDEPQAESEEGESDGN